MNSKSTMLICVTVAVFVLACGPRHASGPGTADTPHAAREEVKERDVSLDDVPLPVKEAMLAEAGEHRITEIEEVRFGDRIEYEAEWKVDGEEVEMTFAADGSLVGRALGDDDADSDADDDGDDDSEVDDD